jgi:hypothetical protein
LLTGGCLCGAVRYTASGKPIVVRTCWCRLCQKLGAGSATVNVGFRAEDVSLTGQLTEYASTADSGTVLRRGFCPVCGTPVTSQAETRKHQIFLRAGTLDDPEQIKPQMTIWTSAAPSWAAIDPSLPTNPAQPAPAAS